MHEKVDHCVMKLTCIEVFIMAMRRFMSMMILTCIEVFIMAMRRFMRMMMLRHW